MGKKLKFAIIGTGVRGVWCFGEIIKKREDAELCALCDTNMIRLKAASEKLNLSPALYTSVEEMAAKEQLDAVIITTPDHTHCEIAIKALQNKWNVLIDKPLATNVKDCRAIIDCAEKNNLTVMMGFNLRHHAVLKRLKEIIDAGTLGNIFLAENREFYDGGKTYMCRWNRFSKNSGGLWIHKGSHDFDIFNWLLGFPKPLRVSAFAAVNVLTPQGIPFELKNGIAPGPGCNECFYKDKCRDSFDFNELEQKFWGGNAIEKDGYLRNTCMYLSEKDTHDNGVAMVEYENGIKVTHMECFIGNRNDRCYTIVGDRGIAEVSLSDRTIRITPRWKGEIVTYTIAPEDGGHGGADPALVEKFCQVLKGDSSPNSTLEHGMLATAIGQAAELSRREHRMVELSELLGE